jgi:hypothetical protein
MMGKTESCQILSVWTALIVFGLRYLSTGARIGGSDVTIPRRATESARCVQQ